MWGGSMIRDIQRNAAAKAAREKKTPLIVWPEDVETWKSRPAEVTFPFLGDYVPKGWVLERELFVDRSGMGRPGELAMTWEQFLSEVQPGMGYAGIELGQFQCYIGEYRKEKAA